MMMITYRDPATGATACVHEETGGYEDWEVIATGEGLQPENAVVEDGAWTVPLSVFQTAKRAEIDARLAAAFAVGFNPSGGTLAGQTLQVRGMEDRTNWLTSQAAYLAAVSAGQGEVEEAQFRTASNETFTLTYAEGLSVLLEMAAWGKALMNHSWTLKDAVTAATDKAALDAIEIETGWPS